MAIKIISPPQYGIEGRLGFEGVVFTESSENPLNWPDAVKFAAERDAVLQSLREAAAFSIEAGSRDNAAHCQATRTAAVYFKDKAGKFYVAFDDIPNPQKNIILARVQEGYDANMNRLEWTLSKKDKRIAQLLKRAEKSDRVVQIAEGVLELATAPAGSSEFGSSEAIQALLGDVAEPYAKMLRKCGHSKGFVSFPSLVRLDHYISYNNTVVRPCGLGGDSYDYINNVVADNQFGSSGRSRGVRGAREFSAVKSNVA